MVYSSAPKAIHTNMNGISWFDITYQKEIANISSENADYASKATDRRSMSDRTMMCTGAMCMLIF